MALKMRTGFGEIQKTVERQQQSFTPTTGKLNYFSLDKGESMFVRFLDDQVVTAKFYEWIMNNQGKATSEFIMAPDLYQYDPDWQGKDWLQAYRSPTPGIGWQKPFGSNDLVEPKLAERSVGIAVKREPDVDASGNIIQGKYRDVLEEIEVDGEKFISLHFMIVRQAVGNFWDQMSGYGGLYGTICDRDYKITRSGEGFHTKYQAIPLNADPGWEYGSAPGEPGPGLLALQQRYGYGVKVTKADGDNVDANNPPGFTWANRYLYCPTTVADWCERRASEEYAKYWLDPNADHLKKDGKGSGGGVSAEQLAKTRPADPREQAPAAVAAPVTQAATAPQNLEQPAAAAAAPESGDRFEEMRKAMEERHKAQASSS